MIDSYLTIKKETEVEQKIKNSRFIGRTFLVQSEDAMAERLNGIRKMEYQANHNCYAYKIGLDPKNYLIKYSDDGEPSGTAGRPMFDYLDGSGATNLLVVVTRYFGGTKLGTGGLVSAYGGCAKEVLEKSGIKENYITESLKVTIEFPVYDKINKMVHSIGASVINSDFTDKVNLEIEIRLSKLEQLKNEIINISHGQAIFE